MGEVPLYMEAESVSINTESTSPEGLNVEQQLALNFRIEGRVDRARSSAARFARRKARSSAHTVSRQTVCGVCRVHCDHSTGSQVQSVGCRVLDVGRRVKVVECWVEGGGCGVWGVGCKG